MSQHSKQPSARIAIIGAGISGLACARTLFDHGLEVTLFEKSRGLGGRMATRRTDTGLQFDHGAQYFTVRDERFEQYVHQWKQDGIVAPWEGRICMLSSGEIEWKEKSTPRFVGVPGMSAVCRDLASTLNIKLQTQVSAPEFVDDVWHIRDEQGNQLGEFDYVVVSAPAPQAARLLAASPDLQREASAIKMNGCWAAMVSFGDLLHLRFDGAFVHDSPLSWVARNDSKPARPDKQESWVIHASPEWTTQHIEEEPGAVLPDLIDAFWQATGTSPRKATHNSIHRWRYAIPTETLETRCLFDSQRKIGACGDWCGGPRVEGAFLSGKSIADEVLKNVRTLRFSVA